MYDEIKIDLPNNNDLIFQPKDTPISIDTFKWIMSNKEGINPYLYIPSFRFNI
jgi:hypothetical protein